MYDFIIGAMIVVSVLMIIVVALQPTKTQNSSNAFMGGGSSNTAVRTKARGFEAFLQNTTIVLGVLFFVLAIGAAIV